MRDPRNWLRPAAAAVVGSARRVGLVLVRTRRAGHRRRAASHNVRGPRGPHLRDAAEARRVSEDATPGR